MQVRPDIGLTFADALRHVLRQDPDVIMVGEIRDRETADIAIRASLTGHLVFSTLHTNDAPGAITRLVDMGIEPFLVASAIELVIAQRLVRRLCPECARPAPVTKLKLRDSLAILGLDPAEADLIETLNAPVGCDRCRGTGYRGRIGIFEIFKLNDELHELVLKRESTRTLTQSARRQGMRTLQQSGWEKIKAGQTTLDEVLRVITVMEKKVNFRFSIFEFRFLGAHLAPSHKFACSIRHSPGQATPDSLGDPSSPGSKSKFENPNSKIPHASFRLHCS
jgi:type II secretory ATPase GspE/PulE/Tfp pilus assembly ATPase PilB-like protein